MSDSEEESKPMEGTPYFEYFQGDRSFSIWNGLVQISTNHCCRAELLPTDLYEYLSRYGKVPAWTIDKHANEYKQYQQKFGPLIDELVEYIGVYCQNHAQPLAEEVRNDLIPLPLPFFDIINSSDEDAIADNFEPSLKYIFELSAASTYMAKAMYSTNTSTQQAKYRISLQTLQALIWSKQESHDYLPLTIQNYTMQLPPEISEGPTIDIHSAQIFRSARYICPGGMPSYILNSANPSENVDIVHCVMYYQKDDNWELRPAALKEVLVGMTAALHQRRELGFPGHYVFGMLQAQSSIWIFAGKWNPNEERKQGMLAENQANSLLCKCPACEELRAGSKPQNLECDTSIQPRQRQSTSEKVEAKSFGKSQPHQVQNTETASSNGKIPHATKLHPDKDKQHIFLAGMSDKKIIQHDMNIAEIIQEYISDRSTRLRSWMRTGDL